MSRLQSIQTCAKWLFSGLCCLELVVAFCSAALVLLSLQTVCSADVTLAWDASCEPNLDGYRIYYRQKSESYNYDHPDWAGNHTETTCTLYGPGDSTVYCFVARAVDVEGNESGDSNEVCYGPVVASLKVIIYTENVSSTTGGSTDHDGTHSDTHDDRDYVTLEETKQVVAVAASLAPQPAKGLRMYQPGASLMERRMLSHKRRLHVVPPTHSQTFQR